MSYWNRINAAKSLGELNSIESDIRADKSLTSQDSGELVMFIMEREEDFGRIRLD